MKQIIMLVSLFASIGILQFAEANSIIISEINYHPADVGSSPGDYYEYVELKNVSSSAIDISSYSFVDGIVSGFPSGTVLAPGGYFVLARSNAYFKSLYGKDADGQYTANGVLNNGGERLVLVDGNKDTVVKMKYSDGGAWPFLADGYGFSLEIIDEQGKLNSADNWMCSTVFNGSPGESDPRNTIAPIYISEVFAHSVAPAVDSIELYNPNDEAVDVSGWSMTDDDDDVFAYVFPQGTVIQPRSYLVVAQGKISQSGTTVIAVGDMDFGFGLSSNGDDLYLFSAKDGQLTGFVDEVSIFASREGRSINRIETTEGRIVYMESELSLGHEYALPEAGPLVFEEILYAPADGNYEYLKVKNISSDTVNIDLWDFSGIGFEKDSLYADLVPNEFFYLVEDTLSSEDFRLVMSLDDTVKVFTFSKSLNNEGEEIAILERGDSVISSTDTVIPYYQVEVVRYNDKSPWPVDAATEGKTLIRKDLYAFGNDPTNWTSTELELPKAIITGPDLAEKGTTVTVSGRGSIDPQGKTLAYAWQLKTPSDADFKAIGETTSDIEVHISEYGNYIVRLQVSNGEKISFQNDHKIEVLDPATTNAEEVSSSPMIYPTIIDNSFTVDLRSSDYQYVRVVSVDGSTVWEGKLTGKTNSIALNTLNLDKGYLVVILSNESSVYAEKVYFSGK